MDYLCAMTHVPYRSYPKGPSPAAVTVARNLRRLRGTLGLDLGTLAERTGVDADKLERLESGKDEASLTLLWMIADTLGVPFSTLLAEHAAGGTLVTRKEKASVFSSESFGLASRALIPADGDGGVEFYELRLAPHHRESSKPHPPGTTELLHVAEGALEVVVGREAPHLVNKGDTIRFPADLPHGYRNLTALPATLYLVMTYRSHVAKR